MELSLAKIWEFYQYYLLAAVLMSWLQLSPENPIRQFLEMFTEPVLAQARKDHPALGRNRLFSDRGLHSTGDRRGLGPREWFLTHRPAQHSSKNHSDLSHWRLKLIGWPSDAERSPVLLVPGHLCPHNFWLPPKRNGFGDWLWEHNFRPFALSDPGATERFANHPRRTSDWVFHIIPRAIHAIYEATEKAPHVIGYSAGAAYALACQSLLNPAPKIASLTMVGTQVTIAKESRWVRGALRALGRLAVPINGRWLGLPTSDNSAIELSEYLDLKAGDGELNQPLMHLRSAPSIDIAAPVLTLPAQQIASRPSWGRKSFSSVSKRLTNCL